MRPFDGKALGEQIVDVVKEYVSRVCGTRIEKLEARIAELEQRIKSTEEIK